MNYEQMILRLIDGLQIIEDEVGAAVQIVAHSFLISVPASADKYDDFNESDVETLVDMGWRHNKDFGWMLPVIG